MMKKTPSVLPARITISELARVSDPFPIYQRLLLSNPVCRAGGNQWLVTSYDEVSELLRNPSLRQFQVSAVLKQYPETAEIQSVLNDPATVFTERIMAGLDGSDHKKLRRCMTIALSPSLVEIDEIIARELDDIITRIRQEKEFDAVQELAFVLPIRVMGHIIGIPLSLQNDVACHSLKLASIFSPESNVAEYGDVNAALLWLRKCIAEIISDRRNVGAANSENRDFIDRFLAQDLSHWSEEEVIDNIIFLIFAGFETSLNLIANGFDALLEFPDEQRKLRDDLSLMPYAIEEFLRYNSPVHITGRFTTEALIIAGQRVSKGRVVYLGLASANRDPKQFLQPNILDIGRKSNPHVAFGAGPHQCIGSLIARREAILTFDRMMREFDWLERAGEKTRVKSATLRSLQHLPISLS